MSDSKSNGQKIIVGMDSSPEAAAALAWARHNAGPDGTIVVVRAWDVPVFVSAYAPEVVLPYDFEELAKQGLEETLVEVADDRVSTVVRRGPAGAAIVEEAVDADLIVVGHRGDSRVSMMLGSTANYVVHHATCPVAVIRGHGGPGVANVVVGVDANDLDDDTPSNESVRALQWAYGLAGVEQIRVVHGWFLPPIVVGMFATPVVEVGEMDAVAARSIDMVIGAAGPAPAGVEVVAQVVRATGSEALLKASSKADLVVVGSRGRGGFKGLLLGSTSATVAAHSAAPVVVVR
jgi:nucleotide-binding universal stress UspA family protein